MIEVKLHDIGEGMTEGEILQYFVKVGDVVKADQPVVEVQTDKMTAEIPAPVSGVVQEICIPPGEIATVGTTLLKITEENGAEPLKKPVEVMATHMSMMPPFQTQTVTPLHKKGKKRIPIAAPHTRRLARELGVNLEEVVGTGRGGRIIDEDVYAYAERMKARKAQGAVVEPLSKTIPARDDHAAKPSIEPKKDVEYIPFRGRRKQIAKKMAQSIYTIPHVTHFEEVDVTELFKLRQSWKESGQNISVAAFFIKAVQLALKDFPIFNGKLDEENERIILQPFYNIGIAADTEEGLIVPVIHHVEQKSIRDIHQEMKELNQKAQENRLTAKDITGGTFTVSNVGPFGSIGATPIINYPEVAIMAFHKTKDAPVVRNSEIVIRSIMNISLSFDHRVADGLTAVKFTNRFKELLENPSNIMLELI